MSLEWKGKLESQHMYWSIFRKEGPKELVEKFGDEYNPRNHGPFEHEGYRYAAVKKTGQSGKEYFDIERSPLGRPSTVGDRSAAIEKAHAENMAAIKAQTDAMKADTAELKRSNDIAEKRLIVEDKIREYLEALVRMNVKFTPASEGQKQ